MKGIKRILVKVLGGPEFMTVYVCGGVGLLAKSMEWLPGEIVDGTKVVTSPLGILWILGLFALFLGVVPLVHAMEAKINIENDEEEAKWRAKA